VIASRRGRLGHGGRCRVPGGALELRELRIALVVQRMLKVVLNLPRLSFSFILPPNQEVTR
jgi:hypothetical protein